MKTHYLCLFLLAGIPQLLLGAKFEEQFNYYSVPRTVITELREVDGETHNLGKRKTFETVRLKADPQTRLRVKNLKPPMPEWKWISTSGFDEVIDKFDGGILIGRKGRSGTDTRSGRRYTTNAAMTAFIINHPNYKQIASGDRIGCWAMDKSDTKRTEYGPVKIYDYGKKVDAKEEEERAKKAAQPSKR